MLNNQTTMILVSTIHFKGEWKFPFNPEHTKKDKFTTITGDEVPVSMMKLERPRRFRYGVLPELKSSAVALPFAVSTKHFHGKMTKIMFRHYFFDILITCSLAGIVW